MKTQNIVIIALLLIAGVAVVGFTSGMLSLLGEDVIGPSCDVAPEGGDCELILQLEAGKSLADGYSFDIGTKSIYDEEFKDEREVFLVASGGPYLEENSAALDWEKTFLYVYEMPYEWDNIYAVKTTASTDGRVSTRSSADGRAELSMYSGVITIPYPYSEIQVCNTPSVSDCYNGDYRLLKNYIDSDNGRWQVSTANTALGGYVELEARGNYNSYPPSINGVITSVAEISKGSIPETDRKFVARVEYDNQGYEGSYYHTQPTMKASWKEEYFITNLKVTLGGQDFYTKPGKIEGTVYLPDMAQTINEYCGRTGVFPDDKECVIRMKMSSTSGGTIIVTNELGQLKEIGGDFNFNGITGWVTFDYENEPTNAYITMGLILAVIGGLVFLILRGGKKK